MSKTFNMVGGGGAGGGIRLQAISITAPPNKTLYMTGEAFDPTGMVVTASYSNGAALIATGYAVEPAGPLPEGLEAVTVRYTEGGISAVAVQRLTVRTSWLFGFDINNADSNPATRVSYPDDVENAGFAAAKMDFGSDTFSYGGWPSTPGEKFMPRPCMLRFDGTAAYYLDPDDYTKKEDGTPSDVANISFDGNAMMEWPQIFTKRWESGGMYHFRCSNFPLDSEYECWCSYDINNQEIQHFYTPIFTGTRDSSGRMRSISGMASTVNTTAQQEAEAAKLNGPDIWYTEVMADLLLIQDLLVMLFKNTNLQAAAGNGRTEASGAAETGTMNAKGLFWGANDKTSGVKTFGMEHMWGNIQRRTAGWMYTGSAQLIKLTRGNKDGSTVSDYNVAGDGYISVPNSKISGENYISGMKTMAYGRLPIATSGSSTTYEADKIHPGSSVCYALCGGDWLTREEAGPFFTHFTFPAWSSAAYIGAALSCKPLAAIQTQQEVE